LSIQSIPEDDTRIQLRGQKGLFAKKHLPKNSLLGIYTGNYITNDEFEQLPNINKVALYLYYLLLIFINIAS
jgi:hypothetical protein